MDSKQNVFPYLGENTLPLSSIFFTVGGQREQNERQGGEGLSLILVASTTTGPNRQNIRKARTIVPFFHTPSFLEDNAEDYSTT